MNTEQRQNAHAARALVGKFVRFAHQSDEPENYYKVLRAYCGMIELEGWDGEFSAQIFIEKEATQ